MSTKKDKFNLKDSFYMKLAINLARQRLGLTGENPSVGCVIVRNNELLSLGQTGFNGRPHAEVNAIINSKVNLKGSSLYVTLEPCTHYGKTNPCTNLIIKSKIKKVIFSMFDVDERTKRKSLSILRKKKIIVKYGLLKNEASKIYKQYILNKKKSLPFVVGKIAISKDNCIHSTKTKKITNIHSDSISHLLRYKSDAILISSKTLNIDNPKLNCRLNGLENFSPKRIILDKFLSIKKNSFIFMTSKKKNTVIFYCKGSSKKISLLKKKGIILINLKLNKHGHFHLKTVLKKIFSIGCRNLLVEGGKNLTNNFLKFNLFDEFYLFKSKKNSYGKNKLNITSELKLLSNKYKNKSKLNSFTNDDVIEIYTK